MNWVCEVSEDAAKELRSLPASIQKRVARTIDQMLADPFQGDVKPLKGREWKGIFRRRIGSYRILFTTSGDPKKMFTILRILIRAEGTYK